MAKSFKSYLLEEHELQEISKEEENSNKLIPRLLPGELIIAEADKVLLFVRLKEWKHGCCGTLLVTNFKLSFRTREGPDQEATGCQQSFLLGDTDVSLSNIDAIYLVSKGKKRRLSPGENISSKVKGIQVVCKTMRILTFSFKLSQMASDGKNITNSLLHHAFPRRHQLLFAYDYREPSYYCNNEVCMFQDHSDWTAELKRTQCMGWRVSLANQHYQLSPNLPASLVVPDSVLDWQLMDAARHFRACRPPVWCWGSAESAALVRMADMLPTINDRMQENVMLELVRKAHPRKRQPQVFDLTRFLPTPREVQQFYLKLRELCAPDSAQHFHSQETNYWNLLDSSRWLHLISACLARAAECSKLIMKGVTVVLQEGEGRDLCAVVSSLVQLLCDPSTRTIVGFQSLIQKEWISLGHAFCSRLGHITGVEIEQSPIFLVFLDCVWQLLNQFSSEFEFTETYLTTLWDSSNIGVFDTFLFDCERDRKCAATDHQNPLHLRSVWDWDSQFSTQDIALFKNALFKVIQEQPPVINGATNNDLPKVSQLSLKGNNTMLPVHTGLSSLELWMQCYCRWLPSLEIVGGGRPQLDFQCRLLVDDIMMLRHKLESLRKNQYGTSLIPFNFSDELSFSCDTAQLRDRLQCNPNSFFPFVHHGESSTEPLLNSSFLGDDDDGDVSEMMDSQSSLNITD